MDASCKKSLCMTSYGGIIRIRLKGRSLVTSSQPAYTSSPVFDYGSIIYLFQKKNKRGCLKKIIGLDAPAANPGSPIGYLDSPLKKKKTAQWRSFLFGGGGGNRRASFLRCKNSGCGAPAATAGLPPDCWIKILDPCIQKEKIV